MNWPEPRWPAHLSTRLVVGLATLGPLGRWPAPGTWGSLAGLLFFAVFLPRFPLWSLLAVAVVLGWLAVGICGEAEGRLGRKDPGCVILDEFAAIPLCFLGWPALAELVPPWVVLLAGFAWFRIFDVLKPPGVREWQRLPAGWGVVADDLAAALFACAALHLSVRWLAG